MRDSKNLFFKEDLSDNEEMFPKEITKWSSNDLMDKIETPECDDVQGNFFFLKSKPHVIFHGLSRSLLQPHSEQCKTCYLHLMIGEAEAERRKDCLALLERRCLVGDGRRKLLVLFISHVG